MLLTGPGAFEFVLRSGIQHEESASVSSFEPTTVDVFHNDVHIDHVEIANGATHSWWSTNPLVRRPEVGDRVRIVIAGPGSMRVDWPFEAVL